MHKSIHAGELIDDVLSFSFVPKLRQRLRPRLKATKVEVCMLRAWPQTSESTAWLGSRGVLCNGCRGSEKKKIHPRPRGVAICFFFSDLPIFPQPR